MHAVVDEEEDEGVCVCVFWCFLTMHAVVDEEEDDK